MESLILRQTRVPADWIAEFKGFAARRSKETGEKYTLQNLYEEAVVQLLRHRHKIQEQGKMVIYLNSPTGGKELNMKIRKDLARRVQRISEADGTKARRFLFTALVHFSKVHKLNNFEVHNGY